MWVKPTVYQTTISDPPFVGFSASAGQVKAGRRAPARDKASERTRDALAAEARRVYVTGGTVSRFQNPPDATGAPCRSSPKSRKNAWTRSNKGAKSPKINLTQKWFS